MNDPIVEEVRRIRAEIAARIGNDLRRILKTRGGAKSPTDVGSSPTIRRTPKCARASSVRNHRSRDGAGTESIA